MTHVVVADAPLPELRRRSFDLVPDQRLTLAEIVAQALPNMDDETRLRARVVIGDGADFVPVDASRWRFVRPKHGSIVIVRHVAELGVAAIFTSMGAATGLGLGSFAASALGVVAAVGVAAAGTALVRALVPTLPERRDPSDTEQSYQLEGWANAATPGEPIPYPVGRVRMAPSYAALPFADVIGDDLYRYGLFLWGHGQLALSDFRFGDTPVSEFGDVVLEHRVGYVGEPQHSLIREGIISDDLNLTLDAPDPSLTYRTWTVPEGSDRVRLIFNFRNGLFKADSDGDVHGTEVYIHIEQRANGGPWQPVTLLVEVGPSQTGFYRKHEWTLPYAATWDIRVMRNSAGRTLQRNNDVWWYSAAGIRQVYPLPSNIPLATTAVRVKASDAANETLDRFNGIAHRLIWDFDGTNWVQAYSVNPAAIALDVLRSPASAEPASDAEIHWDEFADFATFCAAKGLTYARVLAESMTTGEVLASICAAGRATWKRDGEGWGIIIDRPQARVLDQISPRNARAFTWSRNWESLPHAFSATFRDATSGFQEAERIVSRPGFAGTPEVIEKITIEGKTDPAEVYRELVRRWYEVLLRPDTFTAIQPGQFRTATRGDAVGLSFDLLDGVQTSARVRRVTERMVELDAPVIMQDGETYGLRWQGYDEADTVGNAVTTTLQTRPGEQRLLVVERGYPVPEVGTLVVFGRIEQVSETCRISRIEPVNADEYRLTLINDAPEIDALVDALVIPAWTRGAGPEAVYTAPPVAPVIGEIGERFETYDYSGTSTTLVTVPVAMPASNVTPVTSISVFHRLQGGSWSEVTMPGVSGRVELAYGFEAIVEIYAVATSVFGGTSAASATEVYTVSSAATALPTALPIDSISATGDLGHTDITVVTMANTAEIQLFRTTSGATLDIEEDAIGRPVRVSPSSTVALVDGDGSSTTLVVPGDMSSPTNWTVPASWTFDGISAAHDTGATDALAYDLSLTAGATYRGLVRVTGRTAGSLSVQLAGGTAVAGPTISADGVELLSLVAVTGNDRLELVPTSDFDGAVTVVILYRAGPTAAPQGALDYYIAPVDETGIANAPTGPITATII